MTSAKKEKILFGLALLSFILASGEVMINGWLGVLMQLVWSGTFLLISWFIVCKMIVMENQKKIRRMIKNAK